MCNAWNHSPDCDCGFGGDTGGGGWPTVPSTWAYRHEDFTRPTTCPECGAPVFFVRHNGGSVWFDELGPPWDKHGCFADDAGGGAIRTALRTAPVGAVLGVVLETLRESPSNWGRVVVRCSDGQVIDERLPFAHLPAGQAVVVRREGGTFTLVPIGNQRSRPSNGHLELLQDSARQYARHIVCPRCGHHVRPENARRVVKGGAELVHCVTCGFEFPAPSHG
jgi:hypothetical protein